MMRQRVSSLPKWRGNISSDDLRMALNNTYQQIVAATKRVDVLIDMGASRMPGNFLSILANFINQAPNNFGIIVFIGDNTYINSLIMTLWRIYPFESKRVTVAASIEAAITVIIDNREMHV
ncbi:MAG: hypothetical protein Q9P01_00815 [Anaerolineae bacterium]|nr:hypothetical protein [Anaerolineae bacterium]